MQLQRIGQTIKEQFIHSLNDKCMLEEIIKELTATNTDDQITSEGMLALAKRVEAQRAQAAVFFVVPGNSQALLRMPDTAVLKLINVNNDSIQAEVVECKTNTGNVRKSNITQETHVGEKGCADTDSYSKSKHSAKGQNDQDNAYKLTIFSHLLM